MSHPEARADTGALAGTWPRVSVVIPTYERRESLLAALESVRAQSFSPLEAIVVDDGSTDGSAEAVRARFPEVRLLVHERNRGVSAARNTGIAAARGDLVAFLDSDDLWRPGKLARQVAAIDASPDTVACFTATEQPEWPHVPDVPPARGPLNTRLLQLLEGRFVGLPSACLARREALVRIGGFHEGHRANEDVDAWLRLAPLGGFAWVPERLNVRRVRADALSRVPAAMDHGRDATLARFLARPEARLVRRHVRRIRAIRESRRAELAVYERTFLPAATHLAAALAMDPVACLRDDAARARALRMLRTIAAHLLGRERRRLP